MHPNLVLRGLDEFETAFLEQMLVTARNWNPAFQQPVEYWRAQPNFSTYIGGWKHEGDYGFVVEAKGVEVAAVWMRHLHADNPGRAYIDDKTPELTIAVARPFRRQGIGHTLLQAAVDAADETLSLSVEQANPARILFESVGFTPVARDGTAVTMLWTRPEGETPWV